MNRVNSVLNHWLVHTKLRTICTCTVQYVISMKCIAFLFVVHFPTCPVYRLEKGVPYFIEVYLKEGTEEDYVLVQVCMYVFDYT